MLDLLTHFFSAVCGQSSEHTWAPAGLLLPVCQRCTGLYVGAAVALSLHLWLRPRLSRVFMVIHAGFLLLMVPFGYHWVAQGPTIRALTGVLFAFGLVAFFSWPLAQIAETGSQAAPKQTGGWWFTRAALIYAVVLMAACVTLPWLATHGGRGGAIGLASVVCVGAAALAGLVAANTCLAATRLWQQREKAPAEVPGRGKSPREM